MIKFLNGTWNSKFTLLVDNLGIIHWFVDASYAMHYDCKGHTGSKKLTLGSGAITSFSRKQKINLNSLTEAELIGVNDTNPQTLWTRYFMECQGYKMKENIAFQDNKSAIILEKNDKKSSSKRMKHIKVHYFLFRTKRIQKRWM